MIYSILDVYLLGFVLSVASQTGVKYSLILVGRHGCATSDKCIDVLFSSMDSYVDV